MFQLPYERASELAPEYAESGKDREYRQFRPGLVPVGYTKALTCFGICGHRYATNAVCMNAHISVPDRHASTSSGLAPMPRHEKGQSPNIMPAACHRRQTQNRFEASNVRMGMSFKGEVGNTFSNTLEMVANLFSRARLCVFPEVSVERLGRWVCCPDPHVRRRREQQWVIRLALL